MPPKSKKRLAAARCEAQKAENAATAARAYSPPQYKPQDPSLQPYWDAFYENPYPNTNERNMLAERLNMSPQGIQQWFVMARRFTHAPDKKSDNDESGEIETTEVEESDEEEVSIEGTIYRYFYRDVFMQQSNVRLELKRKCPSEETTTKDGGMRQTKDSDVVNPKSTHQRGPRGPYTKQSETSLWRRAKHARKYASPIQSFFPVVNRAAKKPRIESPAPRDLLAIQHIIVSDSDSESEQVEQLATSSKVNEVGDLEWESVQSAPLAASGGASEAHSASKDNEPITLEKYHSALKLLELSMDRLKLDVLIPIEPPHDSLPLPMPLEPSPPQAEIPLPMPISEASSREEGPTLQDAEDAVLVEPVDVELLEGADEDERDEPFDVTLGRHLKRLLSIEKKSKKPNAKCLIELTMLSDYNNLRKSYINAGNKSPSMLASNRIAEAKFVSSPGKPVYQNESWFACQLRVKAYHLVRFGSLPGSNRGRGASHYSILCEEDVRRSILTYLRTLKTGTISPLKLRRAVNQEIFPQLGITLSISESTARRWVLRLGYRPVKHSKGMYMDGHERSDVIEYRKKFLELVQALQPLMQQYDDKTDEPLPLNLPEGKKRHIPVGHDECCFHANDRVDTVWLREGEQQLRQKGRGRLIHVSDFIVKEFGRLTLTPEMIKVNEALPPNEQLKVTEARTIIEPGKNYDKYWDMDQLCEQLIRVLKIFDRMYPGCIGVFFFDQSSAHNAFADDALVAT